MEERIITKEMLFAGYQYIKNLYIEGLDVEPSKADAILKTFQISSSPEFNKQREQTKILRENDYFITWRGLTITPKDYDINIIQPIGREFYHNVFEMLIKIAITQGLDFHQTRINLLNYLNQKIKEDSYNGA